MTEEKPFISVLKGNSLSSPPIWIMRQAGRYLSEYKEIRKQAGSFLSLCFNPELAAEVTLQPIRKFDFDASIIFSDILVIPYSLGQDLDYVEGEGPQLTPLKARSDIEKLKKGRVKEKLSPVYEAISLVKKELPEKTALIGFCGGVWTVSTYMVGGKGGSKTDFVDCKKLLKEDRDAYLHLIDILVSESIEYLCGQIEAGAEVIQIFESWASAVEDDDLDDLIFSPTRKIVNSVKNRFPEIPIIGFPRGIKNHAEYIEKTGVDAIGVDEEHDIKEVSKKINGKAIQGNLSNKLLADGTIDEITEAAEKMLNKMDGVPYIFNLGHGILPHTPVKNVEALISVVRKHGK